MNTLIPKVTCSLRRCISVGYVVLLQYINQWFQHLLFLAAALRIFEPFLQWPRNDPNFKHCFFYPLKTTARQNANKIYLSEKQIHRREKVTGMRTMFASREREPTFVFCLCLGEFDLWIGNSQASLVSQMKTSDVFWELKEKEANY